MSSRKIILPDPQKASNEQLTANLENYRRELKKYKDHVEHHAPLIELNKRRLELNTKASAISDTKNRKIEPTYEFERDPEWIALQSEILKVESAQKQRELQKEIARLEEVVKNSQDEIARFEAAIPETIAVMKKRGLEVQDE